MAKLATQASFVRTIIHFWRSGTSWRTFLGHASYIGHETCTRRCVADKNGKRHTGRSSGGMWVYCSRWQFRKESDAQNWGRVSGIKRELVHLFWKLVKPMLGTCAGILVVAKTYLQLLKYGSFIDRKKESANFYKLMPAHVEIGAKKVFSLPWERVRSKKSVQVTEVLVKEMRGLAAKWGGDRYVVPPGLVPLQILAMYMLPFLWNALQQCVIIWAMLARTSFEMTRQVMQAFLRHDCRNVYKLHTSAQEITVK